LNVCLLIIIDIHNLQLFKIGVPKLVITPTLLIVDKTVNNEYSRIKWSNILSKIKTISPNKMKII